MERPIAAPAEDSDGLHDNLPVRRNADVASAEYVDDFDFGNVAKDLGFREVDFVSTEDGDDFAADEILGDDLPLASPKNIYFVQARRRRIVPVADVAKPVVHALTEFIHAVMEFVPGRPDLAGPDPGRSLAQNSIVSRTGRRLEVYRPGRHM